jgi:hypothetical protein
MYTRFDIDIHHDPSIRAADADRESVGDRLRQHHAEGRLDSDEFQERIDRCYAAKTVGQLDELVADLPSEHKHREVRSFRRVYLRTMIPFFPILLTLIVVSAVTGWHGLWIVFPLFFLARMWLFRRVRWGMGWHGHGDQQAI